MDYQPLLLTLKLAVVVTAILLVIGIPLAYGVAFSRSRFKYILETFVSMPLVLPPTVIGFYLLLAMSPQYGIGKFLDTHWGLRLAFSFPGLVIGSVIFSLPFMVNPIKSGFQNFPVTLIEASQSLGKSSAQTLWHVILPNIRSALMTGVIMTFAHTIGEFGVVLMVGGNIPGRTRLASIAIYDQVDALNYGQANMYALALVGVSFVILAVFYYLNRKSLKIF